MGDAMLLQRLGAAGAVAFLRAAVKTRQMVRAIQACAAIIRIQDVADHVAVHHASGASTLVDALDAWPNDVTLNQACLCALFHAWGGGVAPFDDGTAVPTERIVLAIVASVHRHPTELYTCQAACRLFKLFTASESKLLQLPAVVNAVGVAMTNFPSDDPIHHWGATTLCHIHIHTDKSAIVDAQGGHSYAAIVTKTLQLAASAKRPTTVFVAGVAWDHSIATQLAQPPVIEAEM